jgi:hypothetical protein
MDQVGPIKMVQFLTGLIPTITMLAMSIFGFKTPNISCVIEANAQNFSAGMTLFGGFQVCLLSM